MAATASGMNLEAACKTAFGDWNPDNWPNARHRVSATGQLLRLQRTENA